MFMVGKSLRNEQTSMCLYRVAHVTCEPQIPHSPAPVPPGPYPAGCRTLRGARSACTRQCVCKIKVLVNK